MTPEARKLLALALPTVQDYGVLLLDRRGTVVAWLCGAADIFGYTAQEMVGRTASILFTPEDQEKGLDALELEIAARDSS